MVSPDFCVTAVGVKWDIGYRIVTPVIAIPTDWQKQDKVTYQDGRTATEAEAWSLWSVMLSATLKGHELQHMAILNHYLVDNVIFDGASDCSPDVAWNEAKKKARETAGQYVMDQEKLAKNAGDKLDDSYTPSSQLVPDYLRMFGLEKYWPK
jgi:hypothetical protein